MNLKNSGPVVDEPSTVDPPSYEDSTLIERPKKKHIKKHPKKKPIKKNPNNKPNKKNPYVTETPKTRKRAKKNV